MIFKTLRDMPEWAQPTIRALLAAGMLSGTDSNPDLDERRLDMPETMMRTLIVARNMILNQDRLR